MSLDVFVRCECGKLVHTETVTDGKVLLDINHECEDLDVNQDDFAYLPLLIAGVVIWGVVMLIGSVVGIAKGV